MSSSSSDLSPTPRRASSFAVEPPLLESFETRADREREKTESRNKLGIRHAVGLLVLSAIIYGAMKAAPIDVKEEVNLGPLGGCRVGMLVLLAMFATSMMLTNFFPELEVNFVYQFSPYLALAFGWVSCDHGLPWGMHWVYAYLLGSNMRVFGGSIDYRGNARIDYAREMGEASIPILGCKGRLPALVYSRVITILNSSDQYLDSMTAVIAHACDWRLAWAMSVVVVTGVALQALVAYCFMGLQGLHLVLNGGDAESFTLDCRNDIRLGCCDEGFGNEFDYGVARLKNARMFTIAQGLSKVATENVPQAYLAIIFAEEVKPSKFVYISAACSVALALKAFFTSVWLLCKSRDMDKELEAEVQRIRAEGCERRALALSRDLSETDSDASD